MDEVAEISAWCACVGIPMLSVYEKTGRHLLSLWQVLFVGRFIPDDVVGILKGYLPTTQRTISSKLHAYFGRLTPSLQVRALHVPALLNGRDFANTNTISSTLSKHIVQNKGLT